MIIALFVGAYLSGVEATLELEIFLLSFYSIFSLAIILQILKVLNFQLKLEDEFMSYRNLLGITRKIGYEEITNIKVYKDKSNNPIKYKIYIGKRNFIVDNFMVNFNLFNKIIQKRLKTSKNAVKII